MKISVCMATFNGASYLNEQIKSILPQLHPEDEFLVSDDGSTDGTLEILSVYSHTIKLVSSSKVGGIVPNFNRVITAATGDIIVFSDQDDVWLGGRLNMIRYEMQFSDLILMNAHVVDHQLMYSNKTLFKILGVRIGFCSNLVKNSFVGCCMAIRSDVLKSALPLPSYIPMHDWYLGMICEVFYRVKRVEQPYLLYRRHIFSASQTANTSSYSYFRRLSMRIALLFAFFMYSLRIFRT